MKRGFFLICSLLFLPGLWAQAAIPQGWSGITLGQTSEELKKILNSTGVFDYRGESEVSMLNNPVTNLLQVPGIRYVKEGLFQFYQNKLYIFTLIFEEKDLDYNLLYTRLEKKYGVPQSMDPKIARWENAKVQMILEKPLSLKYIDSGVFKDLIKKKSDTQSLGTISREKFLETF